MNDIRSLEPGGSIEMDAGNVKLNIKKGKRKVMDVVVTLALAVAGGVVGIKLKLPAGGLVGAMVAVAAAQVFGLRFATLPAGTSYVLQIMVGMMIGLGITREVALEMKQMAVPGLLLVACMIIAGISIGFLVYKAANGSKM